MNNRKNMGRKRLSKGLLSERKTVPSAHAASRLDIDFLYLDLEDCARCQATERILTEVLDTLRQVLMKAGISTRLRKILMGTREKAEQFRFVSSPTIRINGVDIASFVKENACSCCGEICGDDVTCRVWSWQGQTYEEPPKTLIIHAVLCAARGQLVAAGTNTNPFKLPDNLRRFYDGLALKNGHS